MRVRKKKAKRKKYRLAGVPSNMVCPLELTKLPIVHSVVAALSLSARCTKIKRDGRKAYMSIVSPTARIGFLSLILMARSAKIISTGMIVKPLKRVYIPRSVASATHPFLQEEAISSRSHETKRRKVPNLRTNASKKFFQELVGSAHSEPKGCVMKTLLAGGSEASE